AAAPRRPAPLAGLCRRWGWSCTDGGLACCAGLDTRRSCAASCRSDRRAATAAGSAGAAAAVAAGLAGDALIPHVPRDLIDASVQPGSAQLADDGLAVFLEDGDL